MIRDDIADSLRVFIGACDRRAAERRRDQMRACAPTR